MAGNIFHIFVLHGIVLYLLPVPFKVFGLWDGVVETLGFLPIFVCTVVLSIVAAELLKRFMPCFAGVIFGGR